jgi:hypothetical protein
MTDSKEDLRATMDDVAADSDELEAIEGEKKALEPGDPRIAELSDAAERVARGLLSKTQAERELVEETTED